jgi:hypothetical protein
VINLYEYLLVWFVTFVDGYSDLGLFLMGCIWCTKKVKRGFDIYIYIYIYNFFLFRAILGTLGSLKRL